MGKVVIEKIALGEGKIMNRFRVKSSGELDISILDYGLTVETLKYKGVNRVLTLKEPRDYINNTHYVGATIGRVAGRLSKALIAVDGRDYPLNQNEGKQCLHGGFEGFSNKTWRYRGSSIFAEGKEEEEIRLEFSLFSKDGEGGFPGNLDVKARFSVHKKGKLSIEYFAKTDKKTPITLTNHSYFNLNTDPERSIENHDLRINSKEYIQLNEFKLPKTFRSVKDSPFDFREKKNLALVLQQFNRLGVEGLDHPFIFKNKESVLELLCVPSNTVLRINTTEPCVVVYTGNQIHGGIQFKDGVVGRRHLGICLETQWFPNGINTDFLPNNYLFPEEVYHSKTEYEFHDYKN